MMPLLRSNPNVIGCRLALLLLLLQCCGCAQVHAVAVECPPRPELPAPLAKAPPARPQAGGASASQAPAGAPASAPSAWPWVVVGTAAVLAALAGTAALVLRRRPGIAAASARPGQGT